MSALKESVDRLVRSIVTLPPPPGRPGVDGIANCMRTGTALKTSFRASISPENLYVTPFALGVGGAVSPNARSFEQPIGFGVLSVQMSIVIGALGVVGTVPVDVVVITIFR